MDIDQKRDFLERDERYTQRQNDAGQDQVCAEHIIYGRSEEVGIFEIPEKRDIERKAQHENRQGGMAPLLVPNESLKSPRQHEVDQNGRRDEQYIEGSPPRIEEERRKDQPVQRPCAGQGAEQVEAGEGHRQESENKLIGIEQHFKSRIARTAPCGLPVA